jgi:hypothetical protein
MATTALPLLAIPFPLGVPCLIAAEAHSPPPVLPPGEIVEDPVLNPVRLFGLVQVLPAAAPIVVHLLLGAEGRTLRRDSLTAILK